jgi:hypothetical protein
MEPERLESAKKKSTKKRFSQNQSTGAAYLLSSDSEEESDAARPIQLLYTYLAKGLPDVYWAGDGKSFYLRNLQEVKEPLL